MSTLKERTVGIPGLSPLRAELEALDQVSTLIFLIFTQVQAIRR